MAIVAKRAEKAFEPAPAGSYQGVCVDVVDLGIVESTWDGEVKRQHKIAVVWQIGAPMRDGRPFLVRERYTLSLGDRSRLRPMLESWRGRAFSEAELDGFDVESVLGANCLLSIIHKQGTKGGTFANVASVSPLIKGMAKMAPKDYVRVADREPTAVDAPAHDDSQHESVVDFDDIPF